MVKKKIIGVLALQGDFLEHIITLRKINVSTKEVRLPEDLLFAMNKNKKEAAFFTSLAFTNKKEYIEWIVTAKRPETRAERIKGTVERLSKQWKNPRNL